MISETISREGASLDNMMESARQASNFLKTMANTHRLMILCCLAEQERSVGELEAILGVRQPTLSQQLARLREEGVVKPRRAGKMVYYSLASEEAVALITLLYELFCAPAGKGEVSGATDCLRNSAI